MTVRRHAVFAFIIALALSGPVLAQTAPDHSAGQQLVMSKCFQCHTDSMFRAQRQDRRAWEATIFRMMGRGALFTPEERGQMADFLASDFGPNAPRPAAQEQH